MTNVVPLRTDTPGAPWSDVTDTRPPPPPGEPPTDEKGGGGGSGGVPDGDAPDFGRVVPLGTGKARGRKVYVLLDADGDEQKLGARDITQRSAILGLFGGADGRQFLVDHWPIFETNRAGKVVGNTPIDFDPEACGAALMTACGKLGFAERIEPRGPGVWPHGDGLIVHSGDKLRLGDRVLDPGFRHGRVIYIGGDQRAEPADIPATKAQVRELAEALKLWRFDAEQAEIAGDLLLGLVACGILGRALPWRPHVFLRGEFQAGKSSLARVIAAAAGAGEPTKDITPAGLKRLFNNCSGLMPLDENEHDVNGVTEVVRIMRGSSDGEGNVTFQAGEGGGNDVFRVAGSFLLAATTMPPMTDADASRITVIQVRAADSDGREKVEEARRLAQDLHPAILARVIAAWPRFRQIWTAARKAASDLDATSRSADQIGALVAGWWLLTQDGELPPAVAAKEMRRFAVLLTTRAERESESTGQKVLTHLLGSRIQVADRTSDQMTVSAALDDAVRFQVRWMKGGGELTDGFDDVERTRRRLGANGLLLNVGHEGIGHEGRGWPWPFEGRPRPGLLIGYELPVMRGLFDRSDWPKGAWREPLRDLPGVMVTRRVVKFQGGGPSRAIFVPLWLLGVTNEQLLGVEE